MTCEVYDRSCGGWRGAATSPQPPRMATLWPATVTACAAVETDRTTLVDSRATCTAAAAVSDRVQTQARVCVCVRARASHFYTWDCFHWEYCCWMHGRSGKNSHRRCNDASICQFITQRFWWYRYKLKILIALFLRYNFILTLAQLVCINIPIYVHGCLQCIQGRSWQAAEKKIMSRQRGTVSDFRRLHG